MKPYHLQVVQQLTDADKQARVNAAHILLEMVHMEPDILFMFSDEATFHISGRVNKHNCVIWATEHPKEVREHMRDSAKVNVWCAVSKYGVIGPFFLMNRLSGERITLRCSAHSWRKTYQLQLSSEGTFSKTVPLPITV